ncbi:MAG TPA: CPBP family intramembrane glutamic endopeptidase [Chitinophagaceae bacterium]|nr:CPBP family intramembrane glutamic endopeptidase [Chitinophagaceae bacterium]
MEKVKFVHTKWMIILELLIALFFIFGYNVFEIIPLSETPYIVILAFIALKLHKEGVGALGFTKPKSWTKTILISLIVAISMQLLSIYVTEPVIAQLTGKKADLSSFEGIKGNTMLFLIYFGLIWTLAAFGEEISYRGFTLSKIANLLGSSKAAWILGVLITSILFGVAHYYKGLAGMIDSGISGLIFGSLYVLSGRNLWICIFTHGFVDTYGLLYFYLGFYHG